ncbi:BTAD domain-containing putative transcriptional regulator [Nonomuraea sp. NPDC046802]|uniref:AfsR/SARP family transcriptional regulator n=1 Tax=Nonomuraea sp. NPDC046802 TaxID=3154919 RepID=UPI0033D40A9C
MEAAEFRLLGPVGIWADDRLLGPSTAQQRSVLAMLLLHPGRTVSVDRLVEAVWGRESPASARNAIQGYVSRLRRVLADVPDVELVTLPPGYRLDLDPLRVDLYLARHLVQRARTADLAESAELLRRARELWNGPPLAGVAGEWLGEAFGAALDEELLVAVEERVAVDLRLGRHREWLAELPVLMSEHPLRERLAELMMTALHQVGRRAAALEVFRTTRMRLVEELGIEPGGEMQRLYQAILRDDAADPLPDPAQEVAAHWENTADTPAEGFRPNPPLAGRQGASPGVSSDGGRAGWRGVSPGPALDGGPGAPAGSAPGVPPDGEQTGWPGAPAGPAPGVLPGGGPGAFSGSAPGVSSDGGQAGRPDAAPGRTPAERAGFPSRTRPGPGERALSDPGGDGGVDGELRPGVVPAEVPAGVAAFVGREEEVARVRRALAETGGDRVRICQVSGIGGVGKSALAIRVAHALAEEFPDGRLYVDLHGASPRIGPVSPVEVLGRFLRSLGLAGSAVPTDLEEAAGRFRSLTGGKRILIILDNARDAAQVRPLLPGSPTCAVLITSRRMLTSFEGAVRVPLDVLPGEDALALLTRMVGKERIEAEPAAAREVIRLSGALPLALCLAAARLATRPSWPVSLLAKRLATARRRLDELRADDRAVRASFQAGYQDLAADPDGAAAARMFRLLSLLDGADVSLTTAAALARLSEERAHRLLDLLVDAQLVQNHEPDRYRLHDLLRLFARERAEEEESEQSRLMAVRRALHCYLAGARTAIRMLKADFSWRTEIGPSTLAHPGAVLETNEDLQTWIEAEKDNIVAAVAQTAGTPMAEFGVALATAFAIPLYDAGHWLNLFTLNELALRAAETTGDARYEAFALGDLGWAEVCVGKQSEGIVHLQRALDAHRRLGDVHREAALLDHIGMAHRGMGRFHEAVDYHVRAIALTRKLGNRWAEGGSLTHLGLAYQRIGRFDEAIDVCSQAIDVLEEADVMVDLVSAIGNLAEAYRLAGRPQEAVTHYRRALARYEAAGLGGDYREAEIMWGLGNALNDGGENVEARLFWNRSIGILHRLGLVTSEERHAIYHSAVPATPQVIQRML